MKRLFHRSLLVGALTVAGLASAPATAAPGFGNEDLKGEYLFTVLDVGRRQLPSGAFVINHCVVAGTATFDGIDRMTISGTQRCSQTGTETIGGTQFYTVNADGSFLISESADMSDPVHGQIVDKGRSLLLDGTTRTLPEALSWSGVAMKR
jgi:hypothetical protein